MAGFFPCTFQSSALYPPALVLHHHLQCGQTPDEEQTAGKGELCLLQRINRAIMENRMKKLIINDVLW